MKWNGYCGGMVGVNGAKIRAHVISLAKDLALLSKTNFHVSHLPMILESLVDQSSDKPG